MPIKDTCIYKIFTHAFILIIFYAFYIVSFNEIKDNKDRLEVRFEIKKYKESKLYQDIK